MSLTVLRLRSPFSLHPPNEGVAPIHALRSRACSRRAWAVRRDLSFSHISSRAFAGAQTLEAAHPLTLHTTAHKARWETWHSAHALRLHSVAVRIARARKRLLVGCRRERVDASTTKPAGASKARQAVSLCTLAAGPCVAWDSVAQGAHSTEMRSSAALHRHFGLPSRSQFSAGARKVPSPLKITSLQLFQSQRVFLSQAISSSVIPTDAADARLAFPSPSTMHSLQRQSHTRLRNHTWAGFE